MKTKKKRIAQEIQSRILTIVIAIFMVVAVVVAVMVGNVSLSAQKNDLEMQSKAASYQLEIFFQEYMTIVEQMALDKDVRTLLTETKAGDKITESADYQTVFHEMEKIAAADSDNIQAVWLGDIDANVATQSDGFTSDSSFEITERTWYRAVETNSTILTSAYVEASTVQQLRFMMKMARISLVLQERISHLSILMNCFRLIRLETMDLLF